MERVLSGIRATGDLHFGSLLGAVQKFVQFQEDPDAQGLYFIADYHTLTTLEDPDLLRSNLIEIVKDYLAAGLDPERSILYAQSSVPSIAELSLYLSMMQPLGALQNVPTYKDLLRRNPENVSLGLITYPVLMAADILGPKSTLVPVGEDQKPNVEIARKLARRFNAKYGDVFPVPELMDEDQMVKVPGLDGGKMGKSDAKNAIGITMSKQEILDRYRKGETDPQKVSLRDPGNPYVCKSVYPIHEMITKNESKTREIASMCKSGSLGCVDCKKMLADSLFDILGPFQERRAKFADQDDYVREILHEGGKKARAIIDPTVEEVASCMGIVRF